MSKKNGSDKQTGNKATPPGLIPWKPGQSGNPKGRPPASECMADWVRRLADEVDTTGMTRGELVARAVYEAAIGGDMRACKLILDRLEPVPSGITINNGIGIGQSGLSLIEAIRSDPEKFRMMLRANGCELPPTGADE